MNKFVTLNYYPIFYRKDSTALYGDDSFDKPFTVVLNIDAIRMVGSKPCSKRVYKNPEIKSDEFVLKDFYYLTTDIAYGRGLNGVDYCYYYITEESYHKLMEVLNPIQCA